MANSRSLQQAVRFALATITASAGVTTLHAQTAPAQPAEAAAAPLQEVVVTGSRLRTPNETAISPISSVSAADIQATGLTRVEDVLNNLPMVFAAMNSTTSNGADGTASVDLRGLGPQRTLVLVDGLRLGPGNGSGRNFSDINQIPAALIERVDVLTGGASAVYGADAVAGVVNFVLNTHFEGIRVDTGYHFNQHNNNDQRGTDAALTAANDPIPASSVNAAFGKNVAILMGSNFADNKGNATAYITYDNQGAALQSKFDYSSCSLAGAGGKLVCGGSGTSKGGRFYASTPHGSSFIAHTVLPNGTFAPIGTPGNQDTYNYGPLNYYQTPNERWTAGAFLNYEVNSHVTAYANVMYTRNYSQAQIAPSGDFFQPSFVPCADPLLTAQEVATICTAANLAAQGNPFETYNGVNYPGLNFVIGRRNVEGGNRIATFQNDAAREVVGLKGDIGEAWTYNVYAQHGTVDGANTNLNYLGNPQVEEALNVLPGPNGPVCGGPVGKSGPLVPTPAYSTPTNVITSNSVGFTADPQCVPYNIWTPGGVTPQALAFMAIPLTEQGTVTEYVWDASVTGDLGKYGAQLPWADSGLQINVGTEWRSESSAFNPDYEEQQGNAGGGGGAVPVVVGGFHVWEGFTELRLPIAQHQAFAEDLSVEGGYRYSSYSEGFTTNTYKLGLEWAPVRDVRLRGSYQRAVRAPNISELFTPQTVGLDGSQDPCAGAITPTSPSLAACEASGVSAAQYGHIQPNPAAQYNGLLGGNPTLLPEVSDTYTVGLVLSPRAVPNLTLSVDYFDIKIKNVISSLTGNVILNKCLSTLLPVFCNDVHRDATGSLWKSNNGYIIDTTVNEGDLATRGLDIKGSYRQQLPQAGSLLFSLEGTILNALAVTPIPGFGSYDCVGYFGNSCGGASPKWRHVLNATWTTPWDGLDLTLRWRYIGSDVSEQTSSNPFLHTAGGPFVPTENIAAFNYIDLTGVFNLGKNFRLQLGVNNVFDKAPPLYINGDCSTGSGFAAGGANCNGNTYPGVYDAMGRYLFATLTAQF